MSWHSHNCNALLYPGGCTELRRFSTYSHLKYGRIRAGLFTTIGVDLDVDLLILQWFVFRAIGRVSRYVPLVRTLSEVYFGWHHRDAGPFLERHGIYPTLGMHEQLGFIMLRRHHKNRLWLLEPVGYRSKE